MSEKTKLVGARIRLLRLEKNLAQNEVAEKIGISQAHLSNIEKGRNNITLENLLRLHEVLGCSVASFFVDIDGDGVNSKLSGVQVNKNVQANGEAVQNPLEQQFSLAELMQALLLLKK